MAASAATAAAGAVSAATSVSARPATKEIFRLLLWGSEVGGALGTTAQRPYTSPTTHALPRNDPYAVSCGGSHTAILFSEEAPLVHLFGGNKFGQCHTSGQVSDGFEVNFEEPVTAVSLGAHHSLALTSAGRVFAWGFGGYGQLGPQRVIDQSSTGLDCQVEATMGPAPVRAIVAGYHHSLCLLEDGTVGAWGSHMYGQLGRDCSSFNRPQRVDLPGPARCIAAGLSHSLVSLSDGRLFAWGSNRLGQLGMREPLRQSMFPIQVPMPPGMANSPISMVSAGQAHSVVLTEDGGVWTSGGNEAMQLGDPNHRQAPRPAFAQVAGLPPNIVEISAGAFFTLARTAEGDVWGWGSGTDHVLGREEKTPQPKPVPINLNGQKATTISAGWFHAACIVKEIPVIPADRNASTRLHDGDGPQT